MPVHICPTHLIYLGLGPEKGVHWLQCTPPPPLAGFFEKDDIANLILQTIVINYYKIFDDETILISVYFNWIVWAVCNNYLCYNVCMYLYTFVAFFYTHLHWRYFWHVLHVEYGKRGNKNESKDSPVGQLQGYQGQRRKSSSYTVTMYSLPSTWVHEKQQCPGALSTNYNIAISVIVLITVLQSCAFIIPMIIECFLEVG